MGMSRIEITVVGNHGCDRNAKAGEQLAPLCGEPSCIDCRAREFVQKLKVAGACLVGEVGVGNDGAAYRNGARQIHWPDNEAIVDDLVTSTRIKGRF